MKNSMKKIHYKSIFTKIVLFTICASLVFTIPMQLTKTASADEYDDRINALQKEIDSYQVEQEKLNQQSITLENTLAQLYSQSRAIQAEIDISQAKYDQLILEIDKTEKDIQNNKDALGKTVADMYVDDNITPIEMLASSNSISDFIDKQEYRSSIRNQLTATISKIKELKKQLENQKAEVAEVLNDQKNQKVALETKQNEQQTLLNNTRGEEAVYQYLIRDSYDKIAQARAIQAALRYRGNRTGGITVLDGGLYSNYVTDSRFGSWNDYNCPMGGYVGDSYLEFASTLGVDGNGGDGRGYGCRQCASYVAWKIYNATGVYYSWGDAQNFDNNARAIFGDSGNVPRAGSIAVMDEGSYGHVAWVETDPYVNSKGQTVIQVSQYNYNYGTGWGMYSLMELSVGFFDYYVQILK